MASEVPSESDDERWLVIKGRRWRRTDPALPDDVAVRLRSHLGRARSAVRGAMSADDEAAVRRARQRVGLAKTGLGERGARWWETDVAARLAQARSCLAELDRIAPPDAARADPASGVNA